MRIIAGRLKNHSLTAPKGSSTRPTSSKLREAVFNICQHSVDGAHFLDLFAGSGAMGIEALSRGASTAVFIEQSAEPFRCIQENIAHLKLGDQTQALRGDVWKMLEKLTKQEKRFDIIYIDPPYRLGEEPDFWEKLGRVIPPLLAGGGILFVEQGKDGPSPKLENLRLINSRKMGAAALHQFQKEEP